ncbi:MAG: portal protein, partial [Pseudohongiellaceae bacterium]
PGQRKNRQIFDSTACESAREFASVMQSTLTPPWREFSILTLGRQVMLGRSEEDVIAINQQLSDITEIVFDFLNHSNFHAQATEAYMDLSIGTGALISGWEFNERTGVGNLTYKSIPLKILVLEEGPNGMVENVWRLMEVSLEHAMRMWPGISLTQAEQARVTKGDRGKEKFKEAVLFDPQTGDYIQVVVDGKFNVRWQQNQGESNPWIVFRWSVNPIEVYGRGPGINMLPDIRTLNKVKEFLLRNAALSISNVYTRTGGQEGAFNPFTVRLQPNMIIPVKSNATDNPTLRALERSGDLNFADLLLRDLQGDVKRAFLNDQITPEGPVRSATEIAIEDRQLVRRIGAEFGRLQTEFVERLIARAVFILQRENVIPPMRVDGRTITLRHTSPLARAQDQEELLGLQNTMASVAALPLDLIMQKFKVEDLTPWVHEKNGGDPKLIRTPEEQIQFAQNFQQVAAGAAGGEGGEQGALPAPTE